MAQILDSAPSRRVDDVLVLALRSLDRLGCSSIGARLALQTLGNPVLDGRVALTVGESCVALAGIDLLGYLVGRHEALMMLSDCRMRQ